MAKYIAVVEHSIKWEEECNSVQEAIELLRGLIEADKRYIFAGTGDFHWQSHGPKASLAMQVKWFFVDGNNVPKLTCKTIRVKDLVKGNFGGRVSYMPKETMRAIEEYLGDKIF